MVEKKAIFAASGIAVLVVSSPAYAR